MRGEPFIIVSCDVCDDEFEVSLTALAGGGYDERNVDNRLEREGWTKDGERDLCSECSEGDDS